MDNLILTLHIVVCVILVVLVLLQSGKEDMGVIFGGGSSSLFGGAGAGHILVKMTAFIAVVFIATSLSYNIITSNKVSKESSIIELKEDDPFAVPEKAPASLGTTNSSSPALSQDNLSTTILPGTNSSSKLGSNGTVSQ